MILEKTVQKKKEIHNSRFEIFQREKITLHTLASVIGNFVGSFTAVSLGIIFYIWNVKSLLPKNWGSLYQESCN